MKCGRDGPVRKVDGQPNWRGCLTRGDEFLLVLPPGGLENIRNKSLAKSPILCRRRGRSRGSSPHVISCPFPLLLFWETSAFFFRKMSKNIQISIKFGTVLYPDADLHYSAGRGKSGSRLQSQNVKTECHLQPIKQNSSDSRTRCWPIYLFH